jgi:hypothetical protein
MPCAQLGVTYGLVEAVILYQGVERQGTKLLIG